MSKGPVNNLRAAVRFAHPAAPSGCAVASATLRLYAGSARSGRTIEVLRLAGGWTESGITWGNQPPTTGAGCRHDHRHRAIANGTSRPRCGPCTRRASNHGFLVRDAAENADAEQQFNSREKGENQPQLVITFAAPSGRRRLLRRRLRTRPHPSSRSPARRAARSRRARRFTFSANETATFRCRLDAAAFSTTARPASATAGSSPGEHVFHVEATDAAGNVGTASHTWTIVSPPPPPPVLDTGFLGPLAIECRDGRRRQRLPDETLGRARGRRCVRGRHRQRLRHEHELHELEQGPASLPRLRRRPAGERVDQGHRGPPRRPRGQLRAARRACACSSRGTAARRGRRPRRPRRSRPRRRPTCSASATNTWGRTWTRREPRRRQLPGARRQHREQHVARLLARLGRGQGSLHELKHATTLANQRRRPTSRAPTAGSSPAVISSSSSGLRASWRCQR